MADPLTPEECAVLEHLRRQLRMAAQLAALADVSPASDPEHVRIDLRDASVVRRRLR